MTDAPASLKAARSLILTMLPGLDPRSVGIVGNDDHRRNGSSYHLGKSALRPDSYSIVESRRDRTGLSEDAAALDVGWFSVTVRGTTHNLRTYSRWLVAQCQADTPDTADIREVIYSPDGKTVHRWDRLGRRTDGDPSHLQHTHTSYFRDSTGRDQTALYRRYFTEIGLLQEDSMEWNDSFDSDSWKKRYPTNQATYGNALVLGSLYTKDVLAAVGALQTVVANVLANVVADDTEKQQILADAQAKHDQLLAAVRHVDEAVGQVDEQVLARLGAAGRTNEDIAAELRAALGDRAEPVGQLLAAG